VTPRLAPKDQDTETKILAAARRVFIRRGTSGTRVQDIAAEAGVNQALVHYYFGSKEALAERVFLEAAGRVVQALAPLPQREMTLEQMIEHFVTRYIDAMKDVPFVPGYLLAEASQHPERLEALMRAATGSVPSEIAGQTLAHLTRILDARIADGSIRPMTPRQFLIHVMALTVFPFVARPVLSAAFGLDEAAFTHFLEERRAELPGFILNALRP
jgi:TetR/AcrR family transcriptional regulator